MFFRTQLRGRSVLFKRSILVGVTLAYLVSLVCGFLVAQVLARKSYNRYVAPTFEAMDRLELDEARSILQTGGPQALAVYLARLDHVFGGNHHLLAQNGRDFVSGRLEPELLPVYPNRRLRGYSHGTFHLAQLSDDGQYCFAVLGTSIETGPATWAYFAVCLVVTTGLLFFSLLYLVFPLRSIRDALSKFGNGQMETRIVTRRKDEVGQVAATFNAMAERVEQSFRTERSLLQDISHELRAPLARLSLAVHLAKQDRPDEFTQQIERNVQRLSALVGEITEFHQRWSAIENASPMETVELSQLVRAIVEDSSLEASLRSITVNLSARPLELHNARSELIGRVLENILRNAIIHSPDGSRVEVEVRRSAAEAIITVRDFGRGVPTERLERIFDPFYREQDIQNERSGLGLGLSIARRGAQWHGGTLRAENAEPGLRLTATFPLNEARGRETDDVA
jgi:signal transduction histidine kinase